MQRSASLKPRRRKAVTGLEAKHLKRVAAMGCLVCGRPATVHHVTGWADRMGRAPRSERRIVPLCNERPFPHHQKVFDDESNPTSVEGLSHRGFYQRYGIDLMATAEQLWRETCEAVGQEG